jgi:hypothetical protein
MVLIPSMVQSGRRRAQRAVEPRHGGVRRPAAAAATRGARRWTGLNTGASLNGGGVSGYRQDVENARKWRSRPPADSGETEVGRPTINFVPRTGGNTFRSHVFFTGLSGGMQASNFSDELQAAGLRTPAKTNYIYDTSYSLGGPIKRDKIWFYFLGYYRGSENTIPACSTTRTSGTRRSGATVADEQRPALSGGRGPIQPALRLTVQLSSRDKLNLFWDEQISNNSLGAGNATNAPETGGRNHGWQRVQQVKWTSTATNRLLLEAGLGTYLSNWNTRERYAEDQPLSQDVRRAMVQVNEQCAATQPLDAFGRGGTCAQNGGIAGSTIATSRSGTPTGSAPTPGTRPATFVTGAHSIKVGYQGAYHADNRSQEGGSQRPDLPLQQRRPQPVDAAARGLPDLLAGPLQRAVRPGSAHPRPADDDRRACATTTPGATTPSSRSAAPGVRFLPTQFTWAESKGVIGYNDITPRAGAPTTCSATARRHQGERRQVSRGPRSTATATTPRCSPARASISRRRAPGPTPTATTRRTATC